MEAVCGPCRCCADVCVILTGIRFTERNGRRIHMAYRNAKDVLPPELLEKVRQYAGGELLYIPAKESAAWGDKSGARREYAERNAAIRRLRETHTVDELAEMFCLSADSIRKIAR